MDQVELDKKVTELLQRLKSIRDWQDSARRQKKEPRAFIIEFAGMPKAGKSTAIQDVRHFFSHGHKDSRLPKSPAETRSLKYQVLTPAEGVSLRTPGELKSNQLDYNIWAGTYAVQELLQAYHDVRNDVVILDRGPWDAGCWLEYWKNIEGSMTAEEVAAVIKFCQLDNWITRADLHVLLVVDPEEARDRERKYRLIDHDGFAANRDGMTEIRRVYERRFAELCALKARECEHIGELGGLMLDTSKMDRKAVALAIIERAFDVLDAKTHRYGDDFLFTVDDLEKHVRGYLGKMRGTAKHLLDFLPQFVADANALPPQKRISLAREIELARAPDQPLIGLRAPTADNANMLRDGLYELLAKVKGS